MTQLKYLIDELDSIIEDPDSGLPEEVFLLASRITAMVNVDLLIRNDSNETLLTWRGGSYYSPGWHIPGGIVRYKESMYERIKFNSHNMVNGSGMKNAQVTLYQFI